MAFVARASVSIAAPRHDVWAALLRPETTLAILPVSEVIAGWRLGQAFVWTFELAGRPSRVEGFVRKMEDERSLEYEYTDPHGRDVLRVENVHRVTIELEDEELADEADGASAENGRIGTRVSVLQDGNTTPAAHAHAEGGWRLALHNLKYLVEQEGVLQESPIR